MNMKYLGLHKLLWFLIVVSYTLFEGVFILAFGLLYLLWNFKPVNDLWMVFHEAKTDYENKWGGYAYQDKNIIETIIRRYKYTWSKGGPNERY